MAGEPNARAREMYIKGACRFAKSACKRLCPQIVLRATRRGPLCAGHAGQNGRFEISIGR